jgi:hypothetical protein
MESEISLLDKTATTSGPRTLVGLIRIMGWLVFFHITSADKSFSTAGKRTHKLFFARMWLSVIIEWMFIPISSVTTRPITMKCPLIAVYYTSMSIETGLLSSTPTATRDFTFEWLFARMSHLMCA